MIAYIYKLEEGEQLRVAQVPNWTNRAAVLGLLNKVAYQGKFAESVVI
jgi:hypothetical protein